MSGNPEHERGENSPNSMDELEEYERQHPPPDTHALGKLFIALEDTALDRPFDKQPAGEYDAILDKIDDASGDCDQTYNDKCNDLESLSRIADLIAKARELAQGGTFNQERHAEIWEAVLAEKYYDRKFVDRVEVLLRGLLSSARPGNPNDWRVW